jgi:hypothetical protein
MSRGNENVQPEDLYGTPALSELKRSLAGVDPDALPYQDWLAVGMVLKNCYPDEGLGVWDSWSATGAKWKQGECAKKWESSNGTGYTVATLIHLVRKWGERHG